ncbi:MAG: histidine kinase [Arthrobacter sp.]|nr:histidine kinase [Arthrobacter sp.]
MTSSRQWLIPLGLAMVALVVASAALGPVGFSTGGAGMFNAAAAAAFTAAAVPYLLRDRLSQPAYVVLMVVMAAAVVGMRAADPAAEVTALFLIAAFAPLRPPRLLLPALVLLAACAVNVVQLSTGQGVVSLVLATDAGAAFFLLVGVLLRREKEQRERISVLLRQVEAGREAERTAAAAAERARLAREMHDVLAHTLSGLSLHLEGSRLLARGAGADPRLLGSLDRAGALAKSGLAEARRAVLALRDDEAPGPGLLQSLIDQHRDAASGRLRFNSRGEAVPLPPEAALALYRTVQEALSNVRKHAPGADVDVDLSWEPAAVRLTVTDSGAAGGAATGGGAGFGLNGMAERAQLAGGTVEAEPLGSGFRVRLTIPV